MKSLLRSASSFSIGVIVGSMIIWGPSSRAAAAQLPDAVEKYALVRGYKIHYLEAGIGAPVVLLHGLGGDGSRWAPNITALAKDFRVIAVDQIGFGMSDKPLAAYNTAMLSEFLVDFLKIIGIEKASLVGNSMGAIVAEYTAVHYPSVVDRLILSDGAGYARAPGAPPPDSHLVQIQNGTTRVETREFFRILFYNKALVTDALVEDNLARRLQSAFAISKIQESTLSGRGGITDEEMRSIKAPTLIVWGKYDGLFGPPEGLGARLNRDIKGSRLVTIDNAGHLPQLEQAGEFNRLAREFLMPAER
jgi:2-hydroxy-6-oxonona-2,4-dienedioate hydrolase